MQKILFLLEIQAKNKQILDRLQVSFRKVSSVVSDATKGYERFTGKLNKSRLTIGQLKDKINGLREKLENTWDIKEIKKYNNQIHKLERHLEHIERKSTPFIEKLRQGNHIVSSMLSLYAGGTTVKSIAETTAKYEQMQAVLSNTLGSRKLALQKWSMIQNFASTTPFQLDEVFGSYIKLINRGFNATEEQLKSIGDLAAAMGKPYDQLVEAILDAQTFEFERLKEFGIKAQKIGDKIQFTFRGQTKVVNATSDAVTQYVLSLGNLQGISGSMSAMSKTLGGQLSNLRDNIDKLKYKIGQALIPVFSKSIKWLNNFINIAGRVTDFLKRHQALFKSLLTGIITLTSAVAAYTVVQWALNFALLSNPIGLIIIGITMLVSLITYVVIKIERFYNSWKKVRMLFVALTGPIALAIEMVLQLFKAINYLFKYGLKKGFKLWAQEFINEYIVKPINQIISFVNRVLHTKWKPVKLVDWINKDELDKQRAAQKKTYGLSNTISKLTGGGGGNLLGGGGSPLGDMTSSGIEAITSGGKKNITITVQSLVENLTVMAQDIKEGAEEIREIVIQEMLRVINSANEV